MRNVLRLGVDLAGPERPAGSNESERYRVLHSSGAMLWRQEPAGRRRIAREMLNEDL